nr:hypothetical protein [Mangrovicoccus ximenensis]
MAALPLVAILRGIAPDQSVETCRALAETGFRLMEIPLNSPDPFDSIARVRAALPAEVIVGAGTVTSAAAVAQLAAGGAQERRDRHRAAGAEIDHQHQLLDRGQRLAGHRIRQVMARREMARPRLGDPRGHVEQRSGAAGRMDRRGHLHGHPVAVGLVHPIRGQADPAEEGIGGRRAEIRHRVPLQQALVIDIRRPHRADGARPPCRRRQMRPSGPARCS